jgi:hypothetical protein
MMDLKNQLAAVARAVEHFASMTKTPVSPTVKKASASSYLENGSSASPVGQSGDKGKQLPRKTLEGTFADESPSYDRKNSSTRHSPSRDQQQSYSRIAPRQLPPEEYTSSTTEAVDRNALHGVSEPVPDSMSNFHMRTDSVVEYQSAENDIGIRRHQYDSHEMTASLNYSGRNGTQSQPISDIHESTRSFNHTNSTNQGRSQPISDIPQIHNDENGFPLFDTQKHVRDIFGEQENQGTKDSHK